MNAYRAFRKVALAGCLLLRSRSDVCRAQRLSRIRRGVCRDQQFYRNGHQLSHEHARAESRGDRDGALRQSDQQAARARLRARLGHCTGRSRQSLRCRGSECRPCDRRSGRHDVRSQVRAATGRRPRRAVRAHVGAGQGAGGRDVRARSGRARDRAGDGGSVSAGPRARRALCIARASQREAGRSCCRRCGRAGCAGCCEGSVRRIAALLQRRHVHRRGHAGFCLRDDGWRASPERCAQHPLPQRERQADHSCLPIGLERRRSTTSATASRGVAPAHTTPVSKASAFSRGARSIRSSRSRPASPAAPRSTSSASTPRRRSAMPGTTTSSSMRSKCSRARWFAQRARTA